MHEFEVATACGFIVHHSLFKLPQSECDVRRPTTGRLVSSSTSRVRLRTCCTVTRHWHCTLTRARDRRVTSPPITRVKALKGKHRSLVASRSLKLLVLLRPNVGQQLLLVDFQVVQRASHRLQRLLGREHCEGDVPRRRRCQQASDQVLATTGGRHRGKSVCEACRTRVSRPRGAHAQPRPPTPAPPPRSRAPRSRSAAEPSRREAAPAPPPPPSPPP